MVVKGRFSVTSGPEDEIPPEEADMLDRYLPADAANTIRKMIRRAQKLNPWIQSFTDDFQAARQAITNHGNRLDNQATALQTLQGDLQAAKDRITALEGQVATLQGQAQQAAGAIQNIRQRLTAAGIP